MNNATAWGGAITDSSYCDFDSIRDAQSHSGMAVFEARGPCSPDESCLAAYLAAAEPGTYIHCVHNGDDLLNATSYPEMDYKLGAPHGTAPWAAVSGCGASRAGPWRRGTTTKRAAASNGRSLCPELGFKDKNTATRTN